MSICREHKKRVLAEQAAETAADNGEVMETTNEYELMLGQLSTHQRQLSQIQSLERRAEVKREFLPEYNAYIEGILAADTGLQDDVLMTLLVWHVDCGNLDAAMAIAAYALVHDLKMPERFKRKTATLIVEEVSEYSISNDFAEGDDCIEELEHLLELTAERDMPDEVRAKLHKALGLAYEQKDPEIAINHLTRALKLNPRCGVKKLLDKLTKARDKAPDKKETPPENTGPAG